MVSSTALVLKALVPALAWSAVFTMAVAFTDAATDTGFDVDVLVAIAYVETGGTLDAEAVNPKSGACGLMQVIPKWVPESCGDLLDVETGISVGAGVASFWRRYSKRTGEHWLSHYNEGIDVGPRGRGYTRAVLGRLRRIRATRKSISASAELDNGS